MRPRSIRLFLLTLLRWRQWSNLMLVGGVVVMIAELLKETVDRKAPVGIMGFCLLIIGTAIKLRDLLKDFRIWRLLRPTYRGLDDFARRINASPSFVASFITLDPGEARVDGLGLVHEMNALLARIDFVGDDPALNAVAAKINANAFSGSLYHATSQAKLARNRPLARRQPGSFALIRSTRQGFDHVGLAAVLPMNSAGLSAYLAGKLSDNDLAPRHIAHFGDPPKAMLVFLVANASAGGARHGGEGGILDLLVQLCLLQIVVLAAQNGATGEIQVIVANAAPKWGIAFRRMHFVECREYDSADQQTVYECRVSIQGARAALDHVIRTVPRLGEQLKWRAHAPEPQAATWND